MSFHAGRVKSTLPNQHKPQSKLAITQMSSTASLPAWASEPAGTPSYSGGTTPTNAHRRRPRADDSNNAEQPSRDVASMKKEIAEVQAETTQSLDRAIATAQAATSVGGHVAEELVQQREQVLSLQYAFPPVLVDCTYTQIPRV